MRRITIVIPTYWCWPRGQAGLPEDSIFDHPTPIDGAGTLSRCLESLNGLTTHSFQVLLITAPVNTKLDGEVENKVEELIRKASGKAVPLRIGVNAGSLPKALRQEENVAEAMVKAAEEELSILEKLNYHQVVFSLKASHVVTTIEANLLFSEKYDYPLHIGVTEAGPLVQGTVKNTLALSRLLENGVGDTIRVSLSDSPENEIIAGRSILQSLGIRNFGVDLISCPTCGRTVFDVMGFLDKAHRYMERVSKNITVAIMGCPVNGPGEAKRADLGVTGSENQVIFFKKGKIIRREHADDAIEAFKEELEKF